MDLNEVAIRVEGVWLPKQEQHMLHWMTKGKKAFRKDDIITYQWHKQEAAMNAADKYLPEWRSGAFVDIGAHCGFWSMWWAKEVRRVIAYEPVELFRDIFEANVHPRAAYPGGIVMMPFALSDEEGYVDMRFDDHNTGSTRVYGEGEARSGAVIRAKTVTLDDSLPGALGKLRLSVIKIDCEGFEEKVVRGGLASIDKHKPVMVVEQKFDNRYAGVSQTGAVDLLEGMGYRVIKEIGGDYIMAHGDRM